MQLETFVKISDAMMGFARDLATCSHCERGSHGCVLADENMQVLSYGYNGVASGLDNRCLHPTEPGRCGCVHAEANALAKERVRPAFYAFTTGSPCANCAQMLINAGVRRIVYAHETSPFRDPIVGGLQVLMAADGLAWGPWR